jgi:hypothetical protein
MTGSMQPDDLYGLALDEFIPQRGALAKALRADGRRDDAAAVAALRKPSVAAWAVNQLVRSQPSGVQELFAAGDELRDAQARLLDGSGDGKALRAANERERGAVDELVRAARGLLSSDGHELSPAVVERVHDTLHAAALDEGARGQVRDGRLERELRHVGLGLGEGAADPFAIAPAAPKSRAKGSGAKPAKATQRSRAEPPAAAPSSKPSADERRAAREQAKREREQRERRERERTQERKAARTAEAAAKRRAERAGHALTAAEERRERAAQALGQADEALRAAQAEAQEALDAHEQARAQLDAL